MNTPAPAAPQPTQAPKPLQTLATPSALKPIICKYCKHAATEMDNFCPNCGKKLPKVEIHIGIARQIYIYLIAIIAPPFGIIWTIRYARNPHMQVRIVGWVALILTIISAVLTIWFTMDFMNTFQRQFQNLNSLGY